MVEKTCNELKSLQEQGGKKCSKKTDEEDGEGRG